MATSTTELEQQPSPSIQQRYAKAENRYSGLDVVLRDPKVPPKGKLIGGIYAAYIVEMGAMAFANALQANMLVLSFVTLVITAFIYYEPNARSAGHTGPPFTRPRSRRKKRNREPS